MSCPVFHFYQVPSKLSKGLRVTERTQNLFQTNQREINNSRSKKAKVVILVHNMSPCPVLQFYHVSSKYFQGYSTYRADKKFYANTNGIRPKIKPEFCGRWRRTCWGKSHRTWLLNKLISFLALLSWKSDKN